MHRLRAGLVCAFLALAACGTGEQPALEPEPTTEAPGAEAAAVSISEPADGSTVEAGEVKVTVAAESFNVVDKLGQDPVAGEGHVHFYFDVDEIPTTPGQPAVTADAATYHAAATTSYTWPDVEAGEHTFGVQLVNNNHTPLEPPVTAEVTVTVE
ncbi:MAG TPA: DUF4399 domain-containing protein [Actinomycetota bacterium]|nr:DUF4399 domain-containing protein [Actinomycetota bacterium]